MAASKVLKAVKMILLADGQRPTTEDCLLLANDRRLPLLFVKDPGPAPLREPRFNSLKPGRTNATPRRCYRGSPTGQSQ